MASTKDNSKKEILIINREIQDLKEEIKINQDYLENLKAKQVKSYKTLELISELEKAIKSANFQIEDLKADRESEITSAGFTSADFAGRLYANDSTKKLEPKYLNLNNENLVYADDKQVDDYYKGWAKQKHEDWDAKSKAKFAEVMGMTVEEWRAQMPIYNVGLV